MPDHNTQQEQYEWRKAQLGRIIDTWMSGQTKHGDITITASLINAMKNAVDSCKPSAGKEEAEPWTTDEIRNALARGGTIPTVNSISISERTY